MTHYDNLRLGPQRQHEEAVARYTANPKFCKTCEAKLSYDQRYNTFCSQSCSATYSNMHRKRRLKPHGFCANCGQPKDRYNKYCADCISARVYNPRITKLADATHDRIRRRILLEKRGHQCEVCGLSEWMKQPIPIELDHIDGDADNNSADNLRLICPNCHAQTPTYKGANAGKESSRQKKRRRRYKNGKTY